MDASEIINCCHLSKSLKSQQGVTAAPSSESGAMLKSIPSSTEPMLPTTNANISITQASSKIKQMKSKRKLGKGIASTSLRKSQLTPRMALYIPPHLQKTTQQIQAVSKASAKSSPPVHLTPQQEKVQLELVRKFKEKAKAYQQAQYSAKNNNTHKQPENCELNKQRSQPREKTAVSYMTDSLWFPEMKKLLQTKNTAHENFIKSSCKVELQNYKEAKFKLRKLLRKFRSKSKVWPNPYQLDKQASDKTFSSDVSFRHDSGNSEQEYDSSQYLAYTQRREAVQEWYQAIVSFKAKLSCQRKSLEIIKIESSDSEDELPNKSSSNLHERMSAAGGARKSANGGSVVSVTSSPDIIVPSSSRRNTDGSMDASNNEYLNQQFLRRQHDYEREQKFRQTELEMRSGRISPLGSIGHLTDYNFGRNRDTMDQEPLRSYDFPMFGGLPSRMDAKSFPTRQTYDDLLGIEKMPIEPFVGDRKRPLVLVPSVVHVSPGRKVENDPIVHHTIGELCSAPLFGLNRPSGSSHKERRSSPTDRRSSLVVRYPRQASTCDLPRKEVPSPYSERHNSLERRSVRQLSPYSDRCRHNGEISSRELSPYSDRLRTRGKIRQLSPYSDHMRDRLENCANDGGRIRSPRLLSPFSSRKIKRAFESEGSSSQHGRPSPNRNVYDSNRNDFYSIARYGVPEPPLIENNREMLPSVRSSIRYEDPRDTNDVELVMHSNSSRNRVENHNYYGSRDDPTHFMNTEAINSRHVGGRPPNLVERKRKPDDEHNPRPFKRSKH